MWQNYCNFTHSKKKKVAGETMQVEQTKNTVVSRHSLSLYIDSVILASEHALTRVLIGSSIFCVKVNSVRSK